jgi:hypothetical protein
MSIRTLRVGPDACASQRAARTRRLGLGLFLGLIAALLLSPAAALGHAELDTASPADKGTVEGSPTEIVMTFTEPVVPSKSSIKLVDAGGTVIDQGSTVDAGDAKRMRLPISTELAPAMYTVRWTTASAVDGDLDHGTTTFTVAAAAPSASPVPSASPSTSAAPSTASVAPSVAPTGVAPSPSAPASSPSSSASDAIIPIIVALIVLAALGLWLMRGRARVR